MLQVYLKGALLNLSYSTSIQGDSEISLEKKPGSW
jgi:hypothetical protein